MEQGGRASTTGCVRKPPHLVQREVQTQSKGTGREAGRSFSRTAHRAGTGRGPRGTAQQDKGVGGKTGPGPQTRTQAHWTRTYRRSGRQGRALQQTSSPVRAKRLPLTRTRCARRLQLERYPLRIAQRTKPANGATARWQPSSPPHVRHNGAGQWRDPPSLRESEESSDQDSKDEKEQNEAPAASISANHGTARDTWTAQEDEQPAQHDVLTQGSEGWPVEAQQILAPR
ncbi:hypothetical protein NDU88_001976 [Pleurodeles waltl]|uniref:Uncharacterized protein n=1 Tax=Pleurodeles waltl TaxID=8319 RepID=A0AAV7R8M4_PLEWA|nr:hypothetical protein NDU88_001976 [Pleurodeles waltl]